MHKFHGYVSGCIFLVDPFAIPQVRRLYAGELSRYSGALKPSHLALEDTLARMILNLEENFGLSKTERIGFPTLLLLIDVSKLCGRLPERLGRTFSISRTKSSKTRMPKS